MVTPAVAQLLKLNEAVVKTLGTGDWLPSQIWVVPSTPPGLQGLFQEACGEEDHPGPKLQLLKFSESKATP